MAWPQKRVSEMCGGPGESENGQIAITRAQYICRCSEYLEQGQRPAQDLELAS
jgi:hypothetical protein